MESGKYYNPMCEFKFRRRGSNVVSNEKLVNSTVSRFFGYLAILLLLSFSRVQEVVVICGGCFSFDYFKPSYTFRITFFISSPGLETLV